MPKIKYELSDVGTHTACLTKCPNHAKAKKNRKPI